METPYISQLIFQQKLCRPEENDTIYLNHWKRKIYSQDYCAWQGCPSKLMEKSKLFRWVKDKRILHHKIGFTTNVKGTYIVKKYKRRKKNLQNRPQTIKKMAIGACCYCCCYVPSVVSDSVRHNRWQPTRRPCPWDSPGKNTGVGCYFLLQ